MTVTAPGPAHDCPLEPRGPDASPVRTFIALWPDDETVRAFSAWRDACDWPPAARPSPSAHWHVTLQFLGELPAARLPGLADALAFPWPRAAWTWRTLRPWHGGVLVMEPDEVPRELVALHDAVAAAVLRTGLPVDERPWRAHLTLGRHAQGVRLPQDAAVQPAPVRWTAARFCLVASESGSYRMLRSYDARP